MATVLTLSPSHFVNSFCQFLTSEDGDTTIVKGAIGFPSGPLIGFRVIFTNDREMTKQSDMTVKPIPV